MAFIFTAMVTFPDLSTTAFVEPLPVIEFVAKVLDKDVYTRPLSDADRFKVLYVTEAKITILKYHNFRQT